MELNNIVRFNNAVYRTFGALSSSFPLPIDIDAFSLEIVSGPAYEVVNFDEIPTADLPEHLFVRATLDWLKNAGYISVLSFSYASAEGVVFTEKGLQLIGAAPMSLLRGNYT